MTKKFVLVHGLPGSGKTTLLRKLVNEKLKNHDDAEYLNVDMYRDGKQNLDSKLRDTIMYNDYDRRHNSDIWYGFDSKKATVYVDMLCLTNKDLADLIYCLIKRYVHIVDERKFDFTILDFEGDRELCAKNDMIRSFTNPSRSAKATIETETLEDVDTELIGSMVGDQLATDINASCFFNIKTKKVPIWNSNEASSYERVKAFVYSAASNFGTVDKNILRGESWTVSGREWSYTGAEWSVGGQEPEDFNTFDNMMAALCPNISFLNYKKVRKECCEIEEYHDNDYYHSYTKNRWICNLDKLVSIFDEMELLS
ncbi:MAG: AAA family ATPase [Alphaproteobacteria bacterium]|nr:AAA family ATPase [Alphaproteobacteria bacterium]